MTKVPGESVIMLGGNSLTVLLLIILIIILLLPPPIFMSVDHFEHAQSSGFWSCELFCEGF